MRLTTPSVRCVSDRAVCPLYATDRVSCRRRQLSEENRRLQEYQDRESKANKRLSMENEQLQYKLRNHSQSELMQSTPGETGHTGSHGSHGVTAGAARVAGAWKMCEGMKENYDDACPGDFRKMADCMGRDCRKVKSTVS